MSEDTAQNQQSSTLLIVARSYFDGLNNSAGLNQVMVGESVLEEKILKQGAELLVTARQVNDAQAVEYITSVIKQILEKRASYFGAYNIAKAVVDDIKKPEDGLAGKVKAADPAIVNLDVTPKKKNRTSYPKMLDEEVADVIDKFKNNPKEVYSEQELLAILKYYNKLPQYNVFRNSIKPRKIINSVKSGHQPVYLRTSILNFLDVLEKYTFFDWDLNNSVAHELGILNWQVGKLLVHESLKPYAKNMLDLFSVESKEIIWVYKTSAYDTMLGLMHKLVKEGYIANPKEVLSGKAQPKPDQQPVKTKKPRKPKASNGNGVLLDWSGIETYFGLDPGVIVGTDRQDKIEDLLGSPEVPKDGQPGYLASVVESKRKRILAIINS